KMFETPSLIENALEQAKKYGHAGAPESVNRLLRIADNHELSWSQTARMVRVRGKQRDDLRLDLVGVLKFIDQQCFKAILIVPANIAVFPQQVARAKQQIIEIHSIQSPFFRLKSLNIKHREFG